METIEKGYDLFIQAITIVLDFVKSNGWFTNVLFFGNIFASIMGLVASNYFTFVTNGGVAFFMILSSYQNKKTSEDSQRLLREIEKLNK